MPKKKFANHYEDKILVNTSAKKLFAFVDNHAKFSSHMSKSSLMMGGGSMKTKVDSQNGQAVGSHIKLSGNVFGISLFLDEVITLRKPPYKKVWETVGIPKILVIGPYRMGFDIKSENRKSKLRVFIDYGLPSGPTRLLGYLFGSFYAKWCVRQILNDAEKNFSI